MTETDALATKLDRITLLLAALLVVELLELFSVNLSASRIGLLPVVILGLLFFWVIRQVFSEGE